MRQDEMNRVLGMLDDDVIAEALSQKKTRAGGLRNRRLMTALIAASLAVALLIGAASVAFSRRLTGPMLPPEDALIIRNMTAGSQLTPKTVFTSGNYYSVESLGASEGARYATVGSLELSGDLYDSMVASTDENRTWAVEVTVSPNLYLTADYIEKEAAYWMSQYKIEDLSALVGIYEEVKTGFDIEALYEQYKDIYNIDEVYKYFASGKLEADLLSSDISALSAKAEQLWEECVDIKRGYWGDLAQGVREGLESFGVEFLEDDDRFIIFVTEGELLQLQGFPGIQFSRAGKYDIDVGKYSVMKEWKGKLVSSKLYDKLVENEGKDVLFAVTAEPAAIGELLDRSAYEQKYIEVSAELAGRPALRAALEAAASDSAKMVEALSVYGEDIILKYITAAGFESALFDGETAELQVRFNDMRSDLYSTPEQYYEIFAQQVRYLEIKENGVVLYLSAQELATLVTEKEYCYKLAA